MATTTPNLNLTKPSKTDKVNIDNLNANFDTLDKLGVDYIEEQGNTDGWEMFGLIHLTQDIAEGS